MSLVEADRSGKNLILYCSICTATTNSLFYRNRESTKTNKQEQKKNKQASNKQQTSSKQAANKQQTSNKQATNKQQKQQL